MTFREPARACAALALLALSGCVSGVDYVPISDKSYFGYSDRPNADGGHTVRVELMDGGLAMEYWNRRASELCDGKVARKSMHTALQPTTYYDRYGGRPGHYIVEGYVYCEAPAVAERAAEPAA
ncbi:hypothetical protein [Brevundimonas sp.]|uniref:hypothetical protein n=1 Tax=Brevundimonas sp. TaxID=1871086 RepID=UPI0035AFDD6D